MKILVVDDARQLAEIYSEFLLRAGFQTRIACDSNLALSQVSRWSPDIILTDVNMPCGGASVILDGLDGLPQPPPVALMTAGDIDWARMQVSDGRAAAALLKPFPLRDLVDLLKTMGNVFEAGTDRSRMIPDCVMM